MKEDLKSIFISILKAIKKTYEKDRKFIRFEQTKSLIESIENINFVETNSKIQF